MGSNKSIASCKAYEKGITFLFTLLLLFCLHNFDIRTDRSYCTQATDNHLQKHTLVTTGDFGMPDYLKIQVIKPSENDTRQPVAPVKEPSGKATFPGFLSVDSGCDLPDSHNERKNVYAALFPEPVKRSLQENIIALLQPSLENTVLSCLITVVLRH